MFKHKFKIQLAALQYEGLNPLFQYDKGYYVLCISARTQSTVIKFGMDIMPLREPNFTLPFRITLPTDNLSRMPFTLFTV
jgi:hypothetical protein